MKYNIAALFVAGGSLIMASNALGGATEVPTATSEIVTSEIIPYIYHNIELSTIEDIIVDYTDDLLNATHMVKYCSVGSDMIGQADPDLPVIIGAIDSDGLTWNFSNGPYSVVATLIQPQDSAGTSLAYTMTGTATVNKDGKCTGQAGGIIPFGKEALSTIYLAFDASAHENGSLNTLESGEVNAGSITFAISES